MTKQERQIVEMTKREKELLMRAAQTLAWWAEANTSFGVQHYEYAPKWAFDQEGEVDWQWVADEVNRTLSIVK